MINYYSRPDTALVKVDSETKAVINVVNAAQQKTISYLVNEQYYNSMVPVFANFTPSDETTFNAAYNAVKTVLDSL